MLDRINPKNTHYQNRTTRTADSLLARLEPSIAQQLSNEQRQEVKRLLQLAIGKPSQKIVDLSFTIDLLVSRFYFRLLVGEDIRHKNRQQSSGSRIGNIAAVITLIVTLNVLVTISAIVIGYLIKSAIGIDLMPGHWRDWVINQIL
ncbi:MAG: hypothetical protein AAF821_25395 [Cyanobacteria bacterium P01_D01_bin.156]